MEIKKVAVQAVDTYSQQEIDKALRVLLSDLGGIEKFIKKGQTVFLKPNLVAAIEPHKAATTHPVMVASVAKLCVEAGACVVIGDSPGGPYNASFVNNVYKKTGMTVAAEEAGADLNRDFTETVVEYTEGMVAKKVPLCSAMLKADVIINLPKLKTHCFAGLSAACKNMYGAIPGLIKVEWHQYFQDLECFAECLLDIHGALGDKLVLNIVDAVEGMEGMGPTGGTPIRIGLLMASSCAHSTDVVCARIIGERAEALPTITAAVKRGWLNPKFDVEIVGQDIDRFVIKNYKRMEPSSFAATGNNRFLNWLLRRVLSQKPKISKRKCKGCSKCKEHCPVGAIAMKPKGNGKYAQINLDKCIRCFCCQELCPFHLVKIRTPLVVRIMRRSKRRRAARKAKEADSKARRISL